MTNIISNMNECLISEIFAAAKDFAYIASAYCKASSFKKIIVSAVDCRTKVIIVRWQFSDIISGASDLEIYDIAKSNGWTMYFNNCLHAKMYCGDELCVIGSANLTNNGMSGGPPLGNIELCIASKDNGDVKRWFNEILENSYMVNEPIYQAIRNDVEKYILLNGGTPTCRKGFSHEVIKLLQKQILLPKLHIGDFPVLSDPNLIVNQHNMHCEDYKHDLNILGLSGIPTIDEIRNAFEILPGFTWLWDCIENEVYFGELTSKLHDIMHDIPKPYRKDVKVVLHTLINWAAILMPDKIVVDVPNHSQRIRKVKIS